MNVFDLQAMLRLDSSDYDTKLAVAETSANKMGGKLSAGFAKVGTAAKVAATAAGVMLAGTTVATTAIAKQTGQVAEYGDHIDKMSQKLGISATAYQEWDAILQHSGASIDSLKAPMKTLATQAQKNASEFQALGISQQEVASLSQEDLFSRVITGLQGMEQSTEKTALASKLLGKGAVEMGALLNTSAEDTEAMRQAVHDLGGVMSEEAVKNAAAYQDQLQDLQTGFEGLKRNMLGEFMPSLTTVMKGLTDLFAGISSGETDAALETISEGIDDFISKSADIIPKAMEIGGKIIGALAKAVVQNVPKLAAAGTKMVVELAQGLISALPTVASTAIEVVTTFADGIASALPNLIPAAADAVMALADAFISNLPKIVQVAGNLITGLGQGIMNAIPKILQTLPVLIGKLLAGIVKSLPTILATGAKLVVMLAKGIISAIPQLIMAVPRMIATFVKSLFSGFKNIKFGDIGKTILNGITGAFKAVKNVGSTIGGALKSGLEKAKNTNWAEVGKNAITKIGDGLSSLGTFLSDKFGNAFQSAKDFVSNIDWSSVGTKIKDTLSNGLQTLGEIGGKVHEKLTSALEKAKEVDWSEAADHAVTTLLDAWMDLGDKAGEVLSGAFEKAKEFITGTDWTGMATTVGDSIISGITSAGDSIGFAFDSFSSSAKQAWEMLDWAGAGQNAVDWLKSGAESVSGTVSGAFSGAGAAAKSAFQQMDFAGAGRNAVNFIKSGASSVGGAVSSTLSSIGSAASAMFRAAPWSGAGSAAVNFLRSGASSVGSAVSSALRSIGNAAMNAFKGLSWSGVGGNIVRGIASGITSGAGAIVTAAKNAAKKAFDAAKNFLGIASPSKLFRDEVGKRISEGIGVGIMSAVPIKETQWAMSKLLSAASEALDEDYGEDDLFNEYQIVGEINKEDSESGNGYGGEITINVYPSAGMDERALANMVSDRLSEMYRRRRLSYA